MRESGEYLEELLKQLRDWKKVLTELFTKKEGAIDALLENRPYECYGVHWKTLHWLDEALYFLEELPEQFKLLNYSLHSGSKICIEVTFIDTKTDDHIVVYVGGTYDEVYVECTHQSEDGDYDYYWPWHKCGYSNAKQALEYIKEQYKEPAPPFNYELDSSDNVVGFEPHSNKYMFVDEDDKHYDAVMWAGNNVEEVQEFVEEKFAVDCIIKQKEQLYIIVKQFDKFYKLNIGDYVTFNQAKDQIGCLSLLDSKAKCKHGYRVLW